MRRYYIELALDATPSTVAFEAVLSHLESGFGSGTIVKELCQNEVIGNKSEFTQAAHEAASKINIDLKTRVPSKDYLRVCEQRDTALESLREACERLYHFSAAIESKKLKKFVDRLFDKCNTINGEEA